MCWKQWLTAAMMAAAGASVAMASAGDLGWRWASPLPPPVDLLRVVWGDGRYVAAGGEGTVATSPDGRSWSAVQIDPSVTIEALAWGDGRYIAVGRDEDAPADQRLVVFSAAEPWPGAATSL